MSVNAFFYSISCMVLRIFVQHHTAVPTLSPSEQKIVALCSKITAMESSEDFEPMLIELKAAIRQHITDARDKVADFALVIAARDESKAAD
jgi:hypothetical protein